MEGEQVQQTTPNTQPVSEVTTKQPKPQKSSKTLIILLVVITILSLCLSGYLALQNDKLKSEVSELMIICEFMPSAF